MIVVSSASLWKGRRNGLADCAWVNFLSCSLRFGFAPHAPHSHCSESARAAENGSSACGARNDEVDFMLAGSAHARRLDEVLGGIVDAAAGAAARRMNVELSGFGVPAIHRRARRQRQFVMHRSGMIRQHLLDV